MTLLNTSGVLVILTVILLLWFVPRSLRRAPAGPVMEPERVGGIPVLRSRGGTGYFSAVFCSSAGFFPFLPHGGGIRPACARYGFYFADSRIFPDCPLHG